MTVVQPSKSQGRCCRLHFKLLNEARLSCAVMRISSVRMKSICGLVAFTSKAKKPPGVGATIAESLLPSEEKNSTADGWLMPTIRVSLEVVLRIKLEVENGLACVCGPRRARQSFAVQ